MNFFRKIANYIKNIFIKKEKVQVLEAPKQVQKSSEKPDFINSLKVTIKEKKEKKKVETLICEGDGLGIQKKISY